MNLRDLINRLTGKSVVTNVVAQNASVAINGPNSAPVIINDVDTIAEAVTKSTAAQYAALAQGVAGDLQTEFDRQVDHYREQMNSGAVKLALASFEKLLVDQKDNLSDLLLFRIKANIALCQYQLGKFAKAPTLLLEACTFAPEDKRAVAFKALAYILKEDCDTALEYGYEKIREYPDNEILAGFILQAARIKYHNEDSFVDPFQQFGERLQLNQGVRIAHIHLLASRRVEGWRELAQDLLKEYPDDAQVKNLIAMGILHHYVDNRQTTNGFTFTQEEVDELKLAADYIAADWQDFKASDRVAHASDLQNIQNLLILYKLSNNFEALVKECSYVLAELADDQQIIETTAQSLIDLQEADLFEQAVQKVADPINAKKLQFINKLARKDWQSLSKVQDYSFDKFDERFANHARVAVYIAKAFVGHARGKEQLLDLLANCELDSRGRLLLFEFATASKIVSIANMAHEYGHRRVTERSEAIEFFHYMKLVRFLMLWREIVSRLEFHPAAGESYELKHMLALGFLNEHPIRAEAVAFFEKHIIPNPHGFELLAGVFYFKRNDFRRSVPLVEKYLNDGGEDLFAFIVLCDIAKLSHDIPALKQLCDTYDLSTLDGTPEQLMHVAKLRASIGQEAQALAEAYQLLVDHPDSAPVALGFFGTFIMVEKDAILVAVTVVGNGCYYRLVPSEGRTIEKTVDPNTEDLLELSPEKVDFYTRQVWGKGVGYEFTQEKLQGDIVWRVEEVKHPYLHAFHEICQTYETRFPTAGGLWSLRVENNNIDSLLALMQRQAEWDDAVFGEIFEKSMPLEIASGLSKKGIFEVYDLVRSRSGMISTCVGTKEERRSAMELVESYQGRPVILDTYTAKVVVELGILDALKEFFGSVIVSHCTLQTLQMISVDKTDFLGAVGPGNADLIRVITKIQETCEIVEYNFPMESDDLTDKLVETNAGSIAPYFIAKERGALFISEDSYSRGFAANIYQVTDGAWLQVVINILLQRGLITRDLYARAILGVAERKHQFVSVGPIFLEYVYQSDTTADLSQLSTLCEFIGGPQAELESHYQLILQFVLARWVLDYNPRYDLVLEDLLSTSHGDAFPSAKAMKATSMVLDRLITIPGGKQKLLLLKDFSVLRLRDFIIGWWTGHFYRW
ncbi:hypothetical protein ALQ72_04494 [Pseudomonas syringae pv. maculicola]|uniref:hypothetical protein n=1 Tax=Pseudomonas syringae group genomosp. 3 TaxID=251701 RepID=UPI0006B9B1CE|nr:hypothetical protein [Pseudomonas syringae group genomosp. 3]KPB98015.1 Uncharacterized protein AC503_2673 [Pseudomonas syringae pv. maculicola]MBM0210106.1 hypothetical protein [Pseudomonas syringae pv. maculicola]RMM77140.1 hypothetical protein ALQ72_04494 [Pseudomonas syringae pv. maculicola]